jgi:hypothetical protein
MSRSIARCRRTYLGKLLAPTTLAITDWSRTFVETKFRNQPPVATFGSLASASSSYLPRLLPAASVYLALCGLAVDRTAALGTRDATVGQSQPTTRLSTDASRILLLRRHLRLLQHVNPAPANPPPGYPLQGSLRPSASDHRVYFDPVDLDPDRFDHSRVGWQRR